MVTRYNRRFKRKRMGKGRKLNKRQVKDVKRLINRNIELKYFPYVANTTSVTSTGASVGNPFDVPQGNTDTSRNGDSLKWCGKIDFRFEIVNGFGATADLYNKVRVVIYQFKDATISGQSPIPSQIFINGPSGAIDVLSQYNHDFRHDYHILFDKTYHTALSTNVANSTQAPNSTTGVKHYRISLKKANKVVQYQGGGGQATNRLFLYYISDSSAATHPTIQYSLKTFFRDG